MPPDPHSAAPRPRRWLRLSLRATLVLVLLAGGASGWVAHQIRTQRQAVATIRAAGGRVRYDWSRVPVGTVKGRPAYRTEPAAPAWLRRRLGDELFQRVTAVDLDGLVPPEVFPEVLGAVGRFDRLEEFSARHAIGAGDGLRHLRGLRRLEAVSLGAPGVTDAMLATVATIPSLRSLSIGRVFNPRDRPLPETADAPTDAGFAALSTLRGLGHLAIWDCPKLGDATLARLVAALPALQRVHLSGGPSPVAATLAALGKHPDLEALGLERTGVTDADLAAISGLTKVRSLSLDGSRIGDAGMAHLRGLKGLRGLVIRDTDVGDAGLAILGQLTDLEGLTAGGTRITDAGVAHLARLTKLTHLSIGRNNLTDAAMPPLAGLANLERLNLAQTPALTDAGLVPLRMLPKLNDLTITASKVTPAGVAALRQAAPSLKRVTTRQVPTRPAQPASATKQANLPPALPRSP